MSGLQLSVLTLDYNRVLHCINVATNKQQQNITILHTYNIHYIGMTIQTKVIEHDDIID